MLTERVCVGVVRLTVLTEGVYAGVVWLTLCDCKPQLCQCVEQHRDLVHACVRQPLHVLCAPSWC